VDVSVWTSSASHKLFLQPHTDHCISGGGVLAGPEAPALFVRPTRHDFCGGGLLMFVLFDGFLPGHGTRIPRQRVVLAKTCLARMGVWRQTRQTRVGGGLA